MTVCYILRKMKDQSIIQSHRRPFKEIRTCLTNPLNGIGPLRSLRMLSVNRSPSGKECDFWLMERIPISFTAFEKSILVKILTARSKRDRESTKGKEISEILNSTGRKQSEKTTQPQTCAPLKKKRKKEKNNFYQLAQWCKWKIMLWDDCKHADFQMLDKIVQKHRKGQLTVSVTNSAGLLAFWGLYTAVKPFRIQKNWRFSCQLANSNPSTLGKKNFVSENTDNFPNLLLLLWSEITTVCNLLKYIFIVAIRFI